MKIKITTHHTQMLSDTLTPVSIYLRVRDRFAGSILLESSDYHGHENSFSYICCGPMASFQLSDGKISTRLPGQEEVSEPAGKNVIERLNDFKNTFQTQQHSFPFIQSGLFGYTAYDAVRYFEEIAIDVSGSEIPDMMYQFFRYVIVVDHFKNQM
ncbi:MAG: anthranilate synthase component I family protein, partial [Cyclobacteriaceae bacterium]|nr:anthranilate synthase component I family protein [Cyclobacteriaceae bacterium]